jgi:feruloyl esterase
MNSKIRASLHSLIALIVASELLPPSLAQVPRASGTVSQIQPLDLPIVTPVIECSAMALADVSRDVGAPTTVTSATVAKDGPSATYCKLEVEVDHYGTIQLHLPIAAWTQRLLFGGGPGAQVALGTVRVDQFVTASWKDLGHRNDSDIFADNYQYRVNAGYRVAHLQVLAAKALIAKYYGQQARYSYYNACSEPAREGMMLVQRFPGDFDGVGAGCPPINFTVNQTLFQGWNVLTNAGPGRKPIITADKLPILHKAVLEQCDAKDGVEDGIISDPFNCHPDLTVLECKARQDPGTCLTPEQIRVAGELYAGAHDKEGGRLTPGGVLPGSELAWMATIVPGVRNSTEAWDQTSTAVRSQFSYPSLPITWDMGALKFNRATFDAVTKLRSIFDATDPDLAAFAKAGHKLILWQGMGDTNVLPAQSVLYYTALQAQMGTTVVNGFARFYALPGVYHCGGGDGPVISDLLGPLMLWVERGIAPEELQGVHRPRPPGAQAQGAGPQTAAEAAPDLIRPLFPYPYIAKYTGTGDVKQASNYVKGSAQPAPGDLANWFGANFYRPGFQQWCTGNKTGLACKNLP